MKKKVLLIIIIVFIILTIIIISINVTGHNRKNNKDFNFTTAENNQTISYVCDGDNTLNVDLNNKIIINNNGGIVDKLYYENFIDLTKHFDNIVRGYITKVEYVTHDENVFTKIYLHVLENYKGNINNEKIVFYLYGGYIDYSEYYKYTKLSFKDIDLTNHNVEDYVLKTYHNNNSEFLKSCDEIIILLGKYQDYDYFDKDSYQSDSMFYLIKDNDRFIQRYSDVEDKYSININNLDEFIRNIKY